MVEFTKKVTNFSKKRLIIEVPKKYISSKDIKKDDVVKVRKVEEHEDG